ncbi:MAG: hypothetical protein AAF065_11630 [Verrucomicrobiota bacterium]
MNTKFIMKCFDKSGLTTVPCSGFDSGRTGLAVALLLGTATWALLLRTNSIESSSLPLM